MKVPAQALLTWALGTAVLVSIPGTLEQATAPPRTAGRLSTALSQLVVAAPSHQQTYQRRLFGGWVDTDRDGCDTRAEVLSRDLHYEKVRRQPCQVLSGRHTDPYGGQTTTGAANSLDIDHVVSLADAWRSGAWSWTTAQRRAFANDPANLITTTAAQNRVKGDRGPGEWRPANSRHHCRYARTVVTVKGHYQLTVTATDRAALARLLKGCR